MARKWCGLLLLVLAVSSVEARAEEAGLAHDTALIQSCLDGSPDDPRSCIGTIADPCQEQPDGSTTVGIVECYGREQAAWDVLLNEHYRSAVDDAKDADRQIADSGGAQPEAVESLKKAQRAWIAFRDAECDRQFQLNVLGTIRTVAAAACLNSLTADRAIDLAPDPR